jgi:hypothetical protein
LIVEGDKYTFVPFQGICDMLRMEAIITKAQWKGEVDKLHLKNPTITLMFLFIIGTLFLFF